MTKINIELSEQLSGVVHPKRKECFKNSILALLIMSYTGDAKNAKYVEGCIVLYVPSAHGWIEVDGEIVDVTYWGRNRSHNKTPENCSYFAGYKYGVDDIKELVDEHKNLRLPLFELLNGEPAERQIEAMKKGQKSVGASE